MAGPPASAPALACADGFFSAVGGVCPPLWGGGCVCRAAATPKKSVGGSPRVCPPPPSPCDRGWPIKEEPRRRTAAKNAPCRGRRHPPPPQVSDPGRCVSSLRLVRVRRRTGRARRLSLDHPASGWNWWTAPAVAAGRVHRPFCQATPLGPSRAAPPPPSQRPPLCSLPHSFSDKPKHLWATAPRLIQHPFSLRRVVVVVDAGAGLLGHHRSVGVAPQPRDGPTE